MVAQAVSPAFFPNISKPMSAHQVQSGDGAICTDANRAHICLMLHVIKEGFMHMLEIIKYDGSRIINRPTASGLLLIDPA